MQAGNYCYQALVGSTGDDSSFFLASATITQNTNKSKQTGRGREVELAARRIQPNQVDGQNVEQISSRSTTCKIEKPMLADWK